MRNTSFGSFRALDITVFMFYWHCSRKWCDITLKLA